jgi:hypothetical protein
MFSWDKVPLFLLIVIDTTLYFGLLTAYLTNITHFKNININS